MFKITRIAGLLALVFTLGVSSSPAFETIGPYNIQAAPISATLVAGGGGGWLNVVNAPLSINDEFTGFSIIDDGHGNAASGTTIELTFAAGTAVNVAGNDLVMFDGRFSNNSYAVSTDFDGFAAELALLDTAFVDTGVVRSYYFNGNGPFTARVMAAAFDLSALGVPAGGSVSRIRFRGTTGEVDPLGMGSLVPEPVSVLGLVGLGLMGVIARRRR